MPDLAGPDPVATVMSIEETFAITIPDEEAGRINTMGDLYDFVFARVARKQPQICVTSSTFYRLRQALSEVCNAARHCVRPRTRLEELIPLENRRRHWQSLQARLGNLSLPSLRLPGWLEKRIEALSMVPLYVAALCLIVLGLVFRDAPAGPLVFLTGFITFLFGSILGMIVITGALCRRNEKHAIHFPPACTTVRDLVYALLSGRRASPIVSDLARPSDKEIWNTLCVIVGSEFDRDPASFTRASKLFG